LPPTKEEVNAFARVCLSVCLLARLLKNAYMDLDDEMLRVDRRQDMDRLIIPIRIIVRMLESDCFLRYRISADTRNFTSGKSDIYVLAAAATRGFTMVLFTEPVSRRNTFVGGTCAPPSALLVKECTTQFRIQRFAVRIISLLIYACTPCPEKKVPLIFCCNFYKH